jgi:hypothetical protein
MGHAIVPLGVFLMVAVIFTVSMWAFVQNRREAHETMRRALDSGQQLDPKVVAALMRPSGRGVRSAITFLSLAVGFALCGLLLNGVFFSEPHPHLSFGRAFGFYIPAIIFGCLGIGRLISVLVSRRDRADG